MASVNPYRPIFASIRSRGMAFSGTPSQSLQARNFSPIQAVSPAGESLSPWAELSVSRARPWSGRGSGCGRGARADPREPGWDVQGVGAWGGHGDTVVAFMDPAVLIRDGQPITRFSSIDASTPRQPGLLKGELGDGFFEPLPR